MSRIGKQPIELPAKVEIKINRNEVTVKGPKGELTRTFNPDMTISQEDGVVTVARPTDLRHHRALHGLTRALLANMVTGVSEGFRKTLLIEGVGYQANLQGNDIDLKVGLSHPVIIPPPDDNTSFDIPKDSRGRTIHIDGIDNEVVGQIAAEIRGWRPPEPYKGKGIRYVDEVVRRKAGKSGKK
ncbi:MAG: 50S ribosomal protein L6 [Phototrophicaceae bacterium]